MHLKNVLLVSASLLGTYLSSTAQTFIPPNMDFELGTTANWTYYAGTVVSGPTYSLTPTAPVSGLHTLTSGSGTDAYGVFPVVGIGSYSLKLGHDTDQNNADAASYKVHVPAGGAYTLHYSYAVVLESPAHPPSIEPSMKITAVDSVTGTTLPDSLYITPTSSGMTMVTGTDIVYKPWTAATIDFSGYGGHTLIVKFVFADCATGGHFGYGYIDVTNITYLSTTATSAVSTAGNSTINLYPNPNSGDLKIQWSNQQTGAATLTVTDMIGRTVSKSSININSVSGETQVDLGGLNNGMYLVNIKSDKLNYCGKIVVQK